MQNAFPHVGVLYDYTLQSLNPLANAINYVNIALHILTFTYSIGLLVFCCFFVRQLLKRGSRCKKTQDTPINVLSKAAFGFEYNTILVCAQ